jgi:hypothetical protein
MSWLSRSSALLLCVTLMMSCSVRHDEVRIVRSDEYNSGRCWINGHNEFQSFIAIAQEDDEGVPYAISSNCMVTAGYTSSGEATLHLLNTIRMIDTFGTIQRLIPNLNVSDNVRSDQPMPSSDSKIYFFRAHFTRIPDEHSVIYAPRNVVELTDTGVSFEQFLDMAATDREHLLSRFQ